ncbi:MAG TPA: hypothetical protein VL979_06995 [Solirubrobacteraceae bacterium]|nr:hypothetical protein [Solirubrobacteraceae bacterium]
MAATMALVFAMSGGAYALSGGGGGASPSSSAGAVRVVGHAAATKKKKKPVKLRGPRGPRGLAGPAGPAGPTGPAGAQGPQGPAGANGNAGTNGTNGEPGANGQPGKAGESVTLGTASNAQCEFGGTTVSVGGTTKAVCNGETGYSETLPPGKTETGTFGFEGNEEGNGFTEPLSFPIPLEAGAEITAHFVNAGESPPAECEGGTPAHPAAKPGNLCVFQTETGVNAVESVTISPAGGPTRGGPGVVMSIYAEQEELAIIYGSYAVTAPES